MKDPIEKRRLTMATTHGLKTLSLVSGTILAALYSQPGRAWTCTPITSSATIDLGTIIVQRDTPNLSALTGVLQGTRSGYNCINPDSNVGVGVKTYGAYANNNIDGVKRVFASNISGIGYILGVDKNSVWIGGKGFYGSTDTWVMATSAVAALNPNWPLIPQIQLYKTGMLDSGPLTGKVGALISGNAGNIPTSWTTEIPITITGTVTKVACSLTNTSISVPLGDVSATQFTGITTTAGDKTFNLGLSCDKDANINVALAGSQNADTADTSVLALTNAGQSGTASGVGVQLLYGSVPLKLNNNILLKTSAGGQETLPFSARYYQTQTAIGAGLANSSATLNITYQ
ncbi:fimbrial protein [Serratia quinivorans]|uniref:fimbrial protein n=1 Tax=Serratia quinivorans TaxID=137545 RepID=UPI001C442141|nr:fimbrial protein [Serratia quinivorans]MBV6695351.1 type 1 fimbrial protein [Serratia quinivorans]